MRQAPRLEWLVRVPRAAALRSLPEEPCGKAIGENEWMNAAPEETLRIDKWLWAARFFKTRSLASQACELGRVEVNGQRAKASRDVRLGDRLQVKTEGGNYTLEVLQLKEARGSAAVAQTMFRESDESRAARARAVEEHKQMQQAGMLPEGRPTRQDRRALDRARGRIVRF